MKSQVPGSVVAVITSAPTAFHSKMNTCGGVDGC